MTLPKQRISSKHVLMYHRGKCVREESNLESPGAAHAMRLEVEIVLQARSRLTDGKAAGLDDIVYEMLGALFVRAACDIVFCFLVNNYDANIQHFLTLQNKMCKNFTKYANLYSF